ncbi:hypothetical protein EJ03DRAFT_49961 [Teratosphaeria nubilosa]|uniref:Chromo domain-containing protein n=1 Tax=Teratosphaeria nubilosa TaxID=161662 RepID=A0A6G1KTF3_9PEZI|nr:hypothetical protein EJ03DRAFT_49961 [Teratosphaeria nubilosa]
MPPLAVVEIPVLSPSPASSTPPPKQDKGKATVKRQPERRDKENSKPLSIRLDQDAPRAATIIAREITDRGALYTLRIGEVEVPQVELDEILHYVSPEHLELYESQQFIEEEEAQRVAEEAEMQMRLAKLERMKQRANTKGVLMRVDPDDHDAVDSEAFNVATGKHGRARPSYKAQFKMLKARRRRKRNPVTGELMPLSDEDENDDPAALESSDDNGRPSGSVRLNATGMPEPPKRRRRKRDPVTGELMPLEPLGSAKGSHGTSKKLLPFEKKKRRRRKRHPLTGELMPLGWRNDPNNPDDRSTTKAAFGAMSPAMQRMSLSQEQGVKRLKLAHQESEDDGGEQGSVSESDADDTDEVASAATPASALKAVPSPSQGRLRTPLALQQAAASSTGDTSPEPVERKKSTMTSIMQPVAAVTSAEQSEQDDDEEWIVEDILSHRMSDPRTHPPDLGTKLVLLYHVKWEGDPKPTWEPAESFSDPSIIEAYHRMRKQSSRANTASSSQQARVGSTTAPVNSLMQGTVGSRTHPLDLTEEDDEEEGYEIEAILAHELSDPRTHAPDLGREAVMLYKVKWKGYQNPTWEPVGSFDDLDVVNEYRVRVGLPELEGE